MAKTADLPGIDDETIAILEDQVKKGKSRKFILIYKGASIKKLIVFKKGPFGTRIQQAKKEGFRGETVCGLVNGSGVNLTFQLAGNPEVAGAMGVDGTTDKEPTKTTKLKEFLADNNLKKKPIYSIVKDPNQVLKPDSDKDEGSDGQPGSAAPGHAADAGHDHGADGHDHKEGPIGVTGEGERAHVHDHDHDREASSQTDNFTKDDPLLTQLAAELKALGPLVTAAVKSNDNCKKTLFAQLKKGKVATSNKDIKALQGAIKRMKQLLTEIAEVNKLALEIERKMADAGWTKDDDVVRDICKGLTKKQIQNLPTKTRNRMMETLQSGYFSDDDKKAMRKLYSVNYLDPAFEAKDEENRKQLIDKISKDKELKEAKKNWKTMKPEEKQKIMQKVADIQADVYGIPKTKIAFFDKGPHKGNDGKEYITNGLYNHKDGKLKINTNGASAFGDFSRAMATMTHENAHRYQATLVDQLNDGKIKKGDPLYDQAQTFKLNDEYYTNHKPEYFTQPMETHSRVTGGAVDEALKKL